MPNFAVIRNNEIFTVIVADSKEDAEQLMQETCIEIAVGAAAGAGWIWDGTNFTPPVPTE
jgi:hypothetical protein